LAFPCNQFGQQEPGSAQDIKNFVAKFGVQFRLMEKADVNFSNARPVFNYLQSACAGLSVDTIKWNFTKFLVDSAGTPIKRFNHKTNPLSLEQDIIKLLSAVNSPVPSDPWQ